MGIVIQHTFSALKGYGSNQQDKSVTSRVSASIHFFTGVRQERMNTINKPRVINNGYEAAGKTNKIAPDAPPRKQG